MFAPPTPRLRRALEAVVAFATLTDADPPPHPHRRLLRPPLTATPRRPDMALPRPQPCRAPIGPLRPMGAPRLSTSDAATR